MEITLCIRGQKLEAHYPTLYSGSIGVLYARFAEVDFDKTLIKTVRFKTADSDWYTADITDGAALVPHEVIVDGGFDIALAGYDSEDGELTRFLPTNSVHIDVTENGFGDPDAPLKTEGDFESVIAKLDKMAVKGALSSEDNVFDDLPAGVYHLNAGVTNAPVDWGGTLIVSRSEFDERNMVYSDRIFITGDAEYNAEKEGVGFIYQATLYGTAGSELGVDTPWYDVTRKSEIDAEIKTKADLSLVEKLIPKTTAKGETLELTDHLEGISAIDYKIFGNSTQNATPSPENPIEILSTGELVTDETDKYYGKYRIPVEISGGDGVIQTVGIYADEPLRKVGDCADCIDFAERRIVRNIRHFALNSSLNWQDTYSTILHLSLSSEYYVKISTSSRVYLPTKYSPAVVGWFSTTNNYGTSIGFDISSGNWPFTTKAELIEWLDSHDIYVEYPLTTPIYEEIDMPELIMPESDTVHISTATEIPGKIELTYYQDINKKLAELQSMIETA